MAKDSDEAADRPWNGDKAGWVEAEKLLDRKIYDQLGDPGQWYWREKFPLDTGAWNVNELCEQILLSLREQRNAKYADRLEESEEFWSEEWLREWYKHNKRKVYKILEKWTTGTARMDGGAAG